MHGHQRPGGNGVGGGRGRGRGTGNGAFSGGHEIRREMRRPNGDAAHCEPADLTAQMAHLNPYGGGGVVPAPNADGWSSGINKSEECAALSARAHEFVPKSNLNVTAQEFVPRTTARNTSTWAYGQQQQQQPAAIFDVNATLSQTIGTLTYSPGMFDLTANNLAETLNTNVSDVATLEIVSDTILETCIKETNFRYTGARLCHYLSSLMTKPIDGKTFRDVLLNKCCQEHKKHKELMNTNISRVRSFTMFLAELFLQLSAYVGKVQQRFAFLGDAIMELLISLSSLRDKENLKSIAQTLKLSGSVLEYEEKNKEGENKGATPLMDKIMDLVVEISKDESVEPHIAKMMGNLPELRKANWGLSPGAAPAAPPPIPTYQPPPPPQPQQPPMQYNNQYKNSYKHNRRDRHNQQQQQYYDPYASQGYDNEGIFYAPDGAELTYEEYEFMNAQLENAELEAASEGDMPADVEAAFEEFLRSENKK